MLEVSAEFAQNVTFNREKIQKSLPAGHLDATTVADYLVKKVPFLFFDFGALISFFSDQSSVIFALYNVRNHMYFIEEID